jgi:hypothetical protein
MADSQMITKTKHKLDLYEKGLGILKELIVDFLKQDSLKDRFAKIENTLQDIRASTENVASIDQDDTYLENYFEHKFRSLKKDVLSLLSEISQEELRLGGEKAQAYVKSRTEWLRKRIQDNPLLATTLAIVVGMAISGMRRSSRC